MRMEENNQNQIAPQEEQKPEQAIEPVQPQQEPIKPVPLNEAPQGKRGRREEPKEGRRRAKITAASLVSLFYPLLLTSRDRTHYTLLRHLAVDFPNFFAVSHNAHSGAGTKHLFNL